MEPQLNEIIHSILVDEQCFFVYKNLYSTQIYSDKQIKTLFINKNSGLSIKNVHKQCFFLFRMEPQLLINQYFY